MEPHAVALRGTGIGKTGIAKGRAHSCAPGLLQFGSVQPFLNLGEAVQGLVERLVHLGKVQADDVVDVLVKKEEPGTAATPIFRAICSQKSTSDWPGLR